MPTPRIVAVFACRDEAAYLQTFLHHLIAQGLDFAMVDNGSTDGSVDIARSEPFARHMAGLAHVPFDGVFMLRPLLEAKMRLALSTGAPWIVNSCPDEILHPNRADTILADEIATWDRRGYNVVSFDEFVMMPVEGPAGRTADGWPTTRHYYFYQTIAGPQHRAFKAADGLSMIDGAGSWIVGPRNPAPETLVLRHYMFLNQAHANGKLAGRVFAESEIEEGWHVDRNKVLIERFAFPTADRLKALPEPQSHDFDRSRSTARHYWHWGSHRPGQRGAQRVDPTPVW